MSRFVPDGKVKGKDLQENLFLLNIAPIRIIIIFATLLVHCESNVGVKEINGRP